MKFQVFENDPASSKQSSMVGRFFGSLRFLPPAIEKIVFDVHIVKNSTDCLIDYIFDGFGYMVKGRYRGEYMASLSAAMVNKRRCPILKYTNKCGLH